MSDSGRTKEFVPQIRQSLVIALLSRILSPISYARLVTEHSLVKGNSSGLSVDVIERLWHDC